MHLDIRFLSKGRKVATRENSAEEIEGFRELGYLENVPIEMILHCRNYYECHECWRMKDWEGEGVVLQACFVLQCLFVSFVVCF